MISRHYLSLQGVLAERGRLTNADVRRIAKATRGEAIRYLSRLVGDGLAILTGRGRGAHYVPSRKLKRRRPSSS